MEGGETKKNVPYFVIKVNDDGTITQTRTQGGLMSTKPHIIRTPEKRTKDGRTLSIEQKDSLGSSTIRIHEPVGTSAASLLSNILVEAEASSPDRPKTTIQSKVTAKQATLVRKSLGLPKINVPSKLVLVKPGMGAQSAATSGPQIIKIQPQTTMVRHTAILPKQSRKTPLTARATDDMIVMEGETDKIGGSGIIIQVAPAAPSTQMASKIKLSPQKVNVVATPRKTKMEQASTSKVQIIKTVQEIKPKVTPVMRQVIKTTVPVSTSTPIPLPAKSTSPVKVVIVKEGMHPKPIAPKPAPMTISLVPPPPPAKGTVVSSPVKIAPAPGPSSTMTAQRVVQIVPSLKKTMGPVLKLPDKPKQIPPLAAAPAAAVVVEKEEVVVAPKVTPSATVVVAMPRGRGRGRGKVVVMQTKEVAAVKSPGKLTVEEAKQPEEKPPSPAKVAAKVEVEVKSEEVKAKPVGKRGRKPKAVAPPPEEEEEESPAEPEAAAPAPRRVGRPKKAVAPEPAQVQKEEEKPKKAEEEPVAPVVVAAAAPVVVVAPRGRGRAPKKAAEPAKAVETPAAKKAKVEEKKVVVVEKKPAAKVVEKPVEEPKVEEPPKKKGRPAAPKKEEKKEAPAPADSPKKSLSKQVPEDKGYLFSRSVPSGWSRDVIQRKTGKSAGKYDVYVFSPDGQKHRSRADITRYLTLNKSAHPGVKAEDFDFSVAKEAPAKEGGKQAAAEAPKKGKRQAATLVVSLPLKRSRK